MTDREIMQQALDALLHMCNTTKAQNDYNAKIVDKALVALETALAQPEQEPIARCKQCGGALPVTGALDRTGECDCIGQLKVISTLAWFNAPIKTEWGEDMKCASVYIDNNHTLTLYCERSQIHKVPTILRDLL